MVSGEVALGDLAQIYAIETDANSAGLTLADFFDVHLDHAPQEGATLALDSIVLVARSISGGRVSVVGLRLPEDEDTTVPLTRVESLKRRLAELWSSVAGI
jgi:cell volume regulation protein A